METFDDSYQHFESYPANLLYAPIYRGALQTYGKRLSDAEPRLFTKKDAEISVSFRDFLSPSQGESEPLSSGMLSVTARRVSKKRYK